MNVDSPDKIYDEISDFASLTSQMDTYLEEFNQMSKTPMSLVMFKFAIEHISRVSRVLKQDNGHLLLVGTFTLFYVFKHRRFSSVFFCCNPEPSRDDPYCKNTLSTIRFFLLF